ncbi:MAG: ribokinase [Roseibium sp.]|nr:ribokinase [Roseibium sp.]
MTLFVVGALHWDVVVRAPRLPHLDETLRGSSVAYQFGGKGGNQAIAAALAGADVAFAGRIGADDAGKAMRNRLIDAGVDVTGLQVGSGASGMSAAIVDADGNYGAVIVSAENQQFDPHSTAVPRDCGLVLLQNEMAHDAFVETAQKARAAGVPVAFNAAPAKGLHSADLELIDTLIVNRVEAADLLGWTNTELDPKDAITGLKTLAPGADIIMTLGEDGVGFAARNGAVAFQRAIDVDVQSTHGAGDVFVGTYAAEILHGRAMFAAIEAAQEAAAVHISQIR